MHVAFVNENTLGHPSYLLPFVREFGRRPELGITPHVLDATPLPPGLARWGDLSVRGLRKAGLDFHVARWRRAISRHARRQLDALRARTPVAAAVVNTQSAGLALADLAPGLPLLVCLDATFAQLARTPWFAPNGVTAALLPLTLAPVRGRERRLLRAAARLFPWSAPVRDSLRQDYGLPAGRIEVLPPSLDLARLQPAARERPATPRILFLGGDFHRKGGPLLRDVFRRHFAGRAELHVLTQSDIPPEPGLVVRRGVSAHSPEWLAAWRGADVFVFPSRLETFGIVLLEALAFGVPVVASRTGAAADVLEEGRNGLLLEAPTEDALAAALRRVLDDPAGTAARREAGLARVRRDFDLAANAGRLAERLHGAARRG